MNDVNLNIPAEVNTVHTRNKINMVTLATNAVTDSLKPDRYEQGMDLEKFIRECERFFRVTDIAEAQRNLFDICFF